MTTVVNNLERRRKQAQFRDPLKTLDNFDFNLNNKMNRSLVFELATRAAAIRIVLVRIALCPRISLISSESP